MDARRSLLTRFYRSLDVQDVEAVMATLHPDADFPDQIEGGRRVGHDDLRDYWLSAFKIIRTENSLVSTRDLDGGDLEAVVTHHVTSLGGKLWHDGPSTYRFRFRDGLIAGMEQISES